MYDTFADFIKVKDLLVSKAVSRVTTPRVKYPREVCAKGKCELEIGDSPPG